MKNRLLHLPVLPIDSEVFTMNLNMFTFMCIDSFFISYLTSLFSVENTKHRVREHTLERVPWHKPSVIPFATSCSERHCPSLVVHHLHDHCN